MNAPVLLMSLALAAAPGASARSPAVEALARGDFESALRLPARDPGEERYVRARVELARANLPGAEEALRGIPAQRREAAEVSWYLAHARRSSGAIARAAAALCRLGDPSGRACVDAELYAQPVPEPSVELQGRDIVPLASKAPVPLTLVKAGPVETGFIFDSGASESVISTDLAAKLGVRVTAGSFPVGVAGGGGVAQARLAVLPELTVGKTKVRHLRVLVMDLPELEQARISGILSPQQAFHGLTVSIDFGKHQLALDPARASVPPRAPAITVPYVQAGFDLAIPARVGEGPLALFGLDTGMEGACSVATDYLPEVKGLGGLVLRGAGAIAQAEMLPPLPVKVGGVPLNKLGQCSRTAIRKAGVKLAGLLGNGLWRGGTVTLNTVARTVSLSFPPEVQVAVDAGR